MSRLDRAILSVIDFVLGNYPYRLAPRRVAAFAFLWRAVIVRSPHSIEPTRLLSNFLLVVDL
jgi:hypothetical protein